MTGTVRTPNAHRVYLVPYRESWPAEFQTMAAALRRAAGTMALRIDHIGSTAVPGLDAKDVIDIQITVRALAVDDVDRALGRAGFTRRSAIVEDHRPPSDALPREHWQKLFYKPPPASRAANVHVRVQGRANQRYALLCRDFLRQHADTAAAYARFKRRVAKHHVDDLITYVDIKDPVFDIMMTMAEVWAQEVDWSPGPSDA